MTHEGYKKLVDRFVNALFSLDKHFFYLIAIMALGFILRTISAINLGVLADDMHFAPGAINFLSSGKLIYWDQSAGLWFLFTDFIYHIIGTTQFASRFSVVLFGTLTIPLFYLISKELLQNEKIALLNALLIAVSPFALKSAMAEMDTMTLFFTFSAVLLVLKAIHSNYDSRLLALGGFAMGLAIYTKVYVLLFIPGILGFIIYKHRREKKIDWNKILKISLVFLIPAGLLAIPALGHNYLLYKDRGFMDHQFTRVFGLGNGEEIYSWMAGWDTEADYLRFLLTPTDQTPYGKVPQSLGLVYWIFLSDPLIFIIGLVGIVYCYRKKFRRDILVLLLLLFVFLFFYMGSINNLIKHYLFVTYLLSIPASIALARLSERIRSKNTLKIIVLLLILFSLVYLTYGFPTKHFYSKSEVGRMIEFKEESIAENSLVLIDSRVYRGPIAWMFHDRHYLEANYFENLIALRNQEDAKLVQTTVYYIECVPDDCGWGTIHTQPGFNQSMEDMTQYFANTSEKIATIQSPQGRYFAPFFDNEESDYYAVYRTTLALDSRSLALADSTHVWWMHPVGYDQQISPSYDNFSLTTSFDKLIYTIARFISYLALAGILLFILVIVYLAITSGVESFEKPKSEVLVPEVVIDQD